MLVRDAARDYARSTLEAHWDGVFPVNPEHIARRLGIAVYSEVLPENTSGFIIKQVGQDPAIYVQVTDPQVRQNFTTAHELGHYIERTSVLESPDDDFSFVDLREGGKSDLHEFFADEFAGNLLMPESDVRARAAEGWDGIRLAARYNVSVPAARVRLRRLGVG